MWQDLSEEDLILPAQGSDYVLKGSERIIDQNRSNGRSVDAKSQALVSKPPRGGSSRASSPELNSPWRGLLDASTQTDDVAEEIHKDPNSLKINTTVSKESSEINADEISPPPTSSSASSSGRKTETLEALIRADAKKTSFRLDENAPLQSTSKVKATDVLMQLISCGSIAVKDSYSAVGGVSYRSRISRVKLPSPNFSSSRIIRDLDGLIMENPRKFEEKVFFSGSLIETRNREEKFVPSLKRSNSYNEERSAPSAFSLSSLFSPSPDFDNL